MNLIVHDNLIDISTLTWPSADWPGWVQYADEFHSKRASNLTEPIYSDLAVVLARMAQLPVNAWFPYLPPLVPDLSLRGAGLHEVGPGPAVGRHQDADTHTRLGLRRVLSSCLYVHDRWEEDWGGRLVLESGAIISPRPGRLLIFDAREEWHQVEPVTCPAGVTRRSLAMFWYAPVAGDRKRPRADFQPGKNLAIGGEVGV